MLRVAALQFSKQHHQGVLDHFIFADLAIQNHIHQCGKILLTGRGFVHEIENQCGDQQHRRIIPKLITAAGGILGFGVVDNGERQLDGVLIGFEIGHRIVMALKMHKVKHCHADTFRFHDSAEGACQLPFGVQKKIRANQLQRVGLHIKACLAAARSADYDNVEIMFMRMAVGAEAYILGQDVIFFGVFGIAVLDV